MSTLNIPNALPVELTGPDLTPYARGNTGVPYVWQFDGGTAGPEVLITAIVHGNEPCGSVALDWLLQRGFRPLTGRLTLAFVNWRAAAVFDADDPYASRWVDEDLNRVWAPEVLEGERRSAEIERAREILPFVAAADWLLDVHSMQQPAPPLAMAGWQARGVDLARRIGVPGRIVMDRGHAAGLRMRDHGAFASDDGQAASVLLECGQHWAEASAELATEAVARFLNALGMAGPDLIEAAGGAEPPAQSLWQVIEAVTITADHYRHAAPYTGGEIIAAAGTLIGHDGSREVRTPHDDCMLVMPSKRLWRGQTAVRLACRMG